MSKYRTSPDWKTAPISPTCEVAIDVKPFKQCDLATVAAYPASGGGWMALCYKHSMKHPEAIKTDDLISEGETWA